MRKSKTESQKTRQYLLDSALEVFYRKGVARASLQEIAVEAGVTRGALYWHFKNKEDLFEALFENCFGEIMATLDAITIQMSEMDAWEQLKCSFINIFQLVENSNRHKKFCTVINLKCERTVRNQTITDLSEKYHTMCRHRIYETLFLCYQQEKLPKNIDLYKAILYLESSVAGIMQIWLRQPERFDLSTTGMEMLSASMAALEKGWIALKRDK